MKQAYPEIPDLGTINRYLAGFEIEETWRIERDAYLSSSLIRFHETLTFLPPSSHNENLLELGASPYLFSLLLKRFTNYVIQVAGEDFPGREASSQIIKRNKIDEDEFVFDAKNFNVELDAYPYADNSFDVVLCCELLEHLILDPTHMLVEIHRILKPGGILILTTPNVLVLRHINDLVRKRRNIYGPYSGYGIYGRHNREWTIDEVKQLLTGCGFHIEEATIKDTYPHRGYSKWLKKLFLHLRDVIFIQARAEGTPVAYYPDNLYVAQYARSNQKKTF